MRRRKVLEIGFGNAKRITALARKHKGTDFLGIDMLRWKRLQTRQHNLKLIFADATRKIKALEPKSRDMIFMDFFWLEPTPRERTMSQMVFGQGNSNWRYLERFDRFFLDVRRVLRDKGRLCFTMPFQGINHLAGMLEKSKFRITFIEAVSRSKKNASFSMMVHFDKADKTPAVKRARFSSGEMKFFSYDDFIGATSPHKTKKPIRFAPERPVLVVAVKEKEK